MTAFNWQEHKVGYATYDPEDNKIRIYTDRVSKPMYDAFKQEGFGRAYKQGCFYAVWTPYREDIALYLCDKIEDEDSTLAERAEDRQDRFATYSENAQRRSRQADSAARDITKFIPLGQPILIGHHSERRHRRDLARIRNLTDKTIKEHKQSKYWEQRANNVLNNAERKRNPGVISRRIKRLQTDLRKQKRVLSTAQDDTDWIIRRWIQDLPDSDYHTELKDLSLEKQKECQAHIVTIIAKTQATADRWIAHLGGQILYWETIYAEVNDGVTIQEQYPLKKGMWVRNSRWEGWARIKRVNRSRDTKLITTVSIDVDTYTGRDGFLIRKWDYERIAEYKTDES